MIRRTIFWKSPPLVLIILLSLATNPARPQQAGSSAAINDLANMSAGLQEVTAQTMRCVVRIEGDTYLPEQDYYDEEIQESNTPATATEVEGSGIVISSDGYIVTNAHVVSGEHRLRVFLHRSDNATEERVARLVGIDQASDLAVLRIQGSNLPFINLKNAAQAKPGELSLAFGDPFGMDRTVTMGIVSAVNRQMVPDDPRVWVQTDAPINPGNSGGPLVDVQGHLLGVDTVIYSDTGGNEGIALAIPALTVRDVAQALIEHGKVVRVSLGISPFAFTSSIAEALHLSMPSGILAEDVAIGGPAYQAGLKPGDVILGINGQNATTILQFSAMLKTLKPLVPVNADVWRTGRQLRFRIVPVVDETDPLPLAAHVNLRRNLVRRLEILGVTLDTDVKGIIGPTRYQYGVVIAARSSTLRISSDTLQVRDIIYQVNGKNVKNLADLRELLRAVPPGNPLVLQIERDHNLHYVPLGAAKR